jgi:hypothetical protein
LKRLWYWLQRQAHGVGNVVRWVPVIWGDIDWDWTSLAKVMEYKLRRMAKYELYHGSHLTSKKDARNQLICAEILHRLQYRDYTAEASKPWGRNGYVRCDVLTSVQAEKDDMALLGKIIGKYLTHWWD